MSTVTVPCTLSPYFEAQRVLEQRENLTYNNKFCIKRQLGTNSINSSLPSSNLNQTHIFYRHRVVFISPKGGSGSSRIPYETTASLVDVSGNDPLRGPLSICHIRPFTPFELTQAQQHNKKGKVEAIIKISTDFTLNIIVWLYVSLSNFVQYIL